MINITMQPSDTPSLSPRIAVVGVGGAGGNAVNNMISSNLEGCEFVVCNTDSQALNKSLSMTKVQLGEHVTGGLGAGSKPEVGKAAAEESLEEVLRHLEGANMAFITCGMGGGTGTGAAPVIAKACRERGILTVGVVTKPFHFEGSHRMKSAENGIKELQDYVDTLLVIPNQNLFRIANEKTTFAQAFEMADSVLQAGVRGVTDLMVRPGLVNLDFADIRTAMLEQGKAMMGTGEAEGEKRAIEAAEAAINNPLLDDVSMKGAHGVIINVTGGYDMTLFEADEACNRIRDEVDPEANIIFGATFDENLEGRMRVSIVATGIEKEGAASLSGGNGLERATPNTDAVQPTGGPTDGGTSITSQPPVFVSAKTIQGIKAPSPTQTPAQQIVEKQKAARSESGVDMFDQGEFADTSKGEENAGVARNTALRGTRFNDAFIPPKPVEAPSGAASYISSFHGAHVPEKAAEEKQPEQTAMSAPSMSLNPPKSNAQQKQQRKRTPSLFERITGSVQEHIEGLGDTLGARPAIAQPPRQKPTPSTPAMQTSAPIAPSQGSLAIDSPAKPAENVDDQLDIPAFLRRQAN
ncbi:MAG: cell division protein FtsZ [Micavibrio sp.]|nr:cell division protein FtsZ [Micavibrio sp.]|tara:strand:+ start:768 stop:2507 length:1740 start_codon:yes stop_codon:yes gene_type:complete